MLSVHIKRIFWSKLKKEQKPKALVPLTNKRVSAEATKPRVAERLNWCYLIRELLEQYIPEGMDVGWLETQIEIMFSVSWKFGVFSYTAQIESLCFSFSWYCESFIVSLSFMAFLLCRFCLGPQSKVLTIATDLGHHSDPVGSSQSHSYT